VTLHIVAVPRQVETASQRGHRAETRRDLFERLAAAFLRDGAPVQATRYANGVTSRAALALVLVRALEDERVMAKVGRGEGTWDQMVDAIDDALGTLRALGVGARTLGAIEHKEPLARVLRKAIQAQDERLSRAGLVDERMRRTALAEALSRAQPGEVARVVGASSLRAQCLPRWDVDAVWWKPLSTALRRAGGEVAVELPVVVKPIDAARGADPFETVVFDVARALDEPPIEVACESVFGDLTLTTAVPPHARARVAICRALDDEAQARAAVLEVARAIAEGVSVDRIALALPFRVSKATRSALERQFDDARIPLYFGGPEDVTGSLLDTVFSLLSLGAKGLPRRDVAALLRSRVVDARLLSGMEDRRVARAALEDLADVLDRTPTVASAEQEPPSDAAVEGLVATAVVRESPMRDRRGAIARRLGLALRTYQGAGTRMARVRGARALFAQVGLHVGAGLDVRAALARNERPSALTRHEIHAYARDSRVIEAISAALDDIERAAVLLDDDEPCSAETFVHELERTVRLRRAPSAARAGTVRAERIGELAFSVLETVIVVDANASVIPSSDSGGTLMTAALEDALERRDARHAKPASELVELAMVVERARRIVLCYRVADDDGAALAPSPLVSWLERGGVPTRIVHGTPLIGPPTTPHERTLALVAMAPERAPEIAPHAAHVAAREAVREAFHAQALTAPSMAGVATLRDAADLRPLLEIETGGGARPLSVTAVERMARCAFQGFAAQVLGAQDDDPRTDDVPDRREEGIRAHEALAAAFTAIAPLLRVRPRDRDAIERGAMAAAEAVLVRGGSAAVRAAHARIQLEVAKVVDLAIDDNEWDFVLAEQSFGDGAGVTQGGWPAFVVADGETRVSLRGRIDRIDVASDASAVRAIDYKRRVSLPPITDLGSTAIQVPIYALVARSALGAAIAYGRYLSTVSPAQRSTPAFDARFADLVTAAADGSTEASRSVLELVRSLRAGEIAPRPSAAKWCAQCGLDGACRRPRFAVTASGEE